MILCVYYVLLYNRCDIRVLFHIIHCLRTKTVFNSYLSSSNSMASTDVISELCVVLSDVLPIVLVICHAVGNVYVIPGLIVPGHVSIETFRLN
jgi:hypothetical protein